jgi:ribosomal protein S18 acetylase RimI-like enzyme
MLTDRETYKLQRVLGFMRAADAGASTRNVSLPFGTAHFNDELPHVWERNFVLVESRDDVDVAALTDAADELQGGAGLAHRKLVFEDEGLAARLAGELVATGWEQRRLSVMVHGGAVGEGSIAAARDASEVDRRALEPALERLLRTELQGSDSDASRELVRADVPMERFLRQRCFARLVAGDVAAYCRLYARQGIAQIEDVATLPHWRGRGYARTVVSRALVEAREGELTFLTAVNGRWVERWYERLGFRQIALRYEFTRHG